MKFRWTIIKNSNLNALKEEIEILKNPKLGNPSYEQLIKLRNQKINELNDIGSRLKMIERTHKAITTSNGRNVGDYIKKNKNKKDGKR